jgi:hypothetical protein
MIESDRSSRPRVRRKGGRGEPGGPNTHLTDAILDSWVPWLERLKPFLSASYLSPLNTPPSNIKYSSTVSQLASPHPDKPEDHQAPVVRFQHPEFPEISLSSYFRGSDILQSNLRP